MTVGEVLDVTVKVGGVRVSLWLLGVAMTIWELWGVTLTAGSCRGVAVTIGGL